MKFPVRFSSVVAALFLSTAVMANSLEDCDGSGSVFTFDQASYELKPDTQVCATISGDVRQTIPYESTLTLEFSYSGKNQDWTVNFFSNAQDSPIPLPKKERTTITQCFYLPSSFAPLKSGSRVSVTMNAKLPDSQTIFCVTGKITTA